MGSYRPFEDIAWGDARCYHCLFRNPVEVWAGGDPMCLGCADLWLERIIALEISPGLADTLPALWERI